MKCFHGGERSKGEEEDSTSGKGSKKEKETEKNLVFADKLNLSHAKNIAFYLNDSSSFVFARNSKKHKADGLFV